MTNPDGVLAAIDSCLDDYALSDDAMRWAPDEPEPASKEGGLALWGQYMNGDSVYRTTTPPYRFHVVPGEPPSLRGATPSATIVDEATEGWPIIRDRDGTQVDHIVSDGTAVWSPPPAPERQGDVRWWWASAPPDGEQPQWQPIGGEVVSDLTFTRDEDYRVAEDFLSAPRAVSITLTADTSHFRRGLLEALGACYWLRWGREGRMRSMKTEYRRRTRRRNRR
ncbi:MAG: hypothetical protein ABR585_07525 [Gemmatimonadaceae bacterium]